MRIVYLKTRNFADIYVGMNKKEFELDLSKQKNRIILLIGPVGSGKTSILSKLNPFAYPGNMDVRNGPEIILEGEDGYKEIHYSHNGALYVIKHYYQFSSGKGVKSFISRDGTELNPNGNVSSFKEVVDIELSIEPDLMTLLRLGSNVTGLIDKKSTERKAFATELLKDISIYLQLYKKVTNDSRTMKTMLKMVYDRLRQLDISDINIELAKLANNEVELNNAKNEHVKLITKLGESTGTMEQIHPGGYDQLIKEYDDVKYRIKSLNDELNKLNSLRDHINIIIDKNDIDIMITNMAETINRLSNTITVNTASIEFFQTQLNGLLNQRDEKLESKKYISSTGSKKELMIYKERVQAELVDYEKKFENFTPKITVDELKRVVEILGEIEEVIGVITHFGIRRVDETISLRLSGENIDSYVKRHVTEIDSEMSKLTYQLNKQSVSNNIEYDGQYPVLFAHDGCDCPYRKYFNEQKEATKDTTVKDREKLIKRRDSLDEIRESVLSMLDINKNLDFIQLIIRSNRELISRSPVSDIFSIDHIYQSIRIGKPIYDINTITQYMSLLEKYADFKAKKERLIEVERELEFLKKNNLTLNDLESDLKFIEDSIESTNKRIEDLTVINTESEKAVKIEEEILETTKSFKELTDRITNIEKELNIFTNELNILEEKRSKIELINTFKQTAESHIMLANKRIKEIENEISNRRFRIREYDEANKNRQTLEEKYEEIEDVKMALSSKEGIPLLHINIYFNECLNLVNRLLNTAFKGSLEITKFDINDKEFRIPYTKNGVTVDDVVKTSQGEKCFVSIAISFALMANYRNTPDYNIMQFDEVDSTLDISYRPLFLAILEEQLDYIDAEQAFVITHNNMFDNYNVDAIMTADVNIDNSKNVNIIYKP